MLPRCLQEQLMAASSCVCFREGTFQEEARARAARSVEPLAEPSVGPPHTAKHN